jgi:hypothetical protein
MNQSKHWTRTTLLTLFLGAPLAAAQEHAPPSEGPRAPLEERRRFEEAERRLERLEQRIADAGSRAAAREAGPIGAGRPWAERGARPGALVDAARARLRQRGSRGLEIGRFQGWSSGSWGRAPRADGQRRFLRELGEGAREQATRRDRGARGGAAASDAGCDRCTPQRGTADGGAARPDRGGRRGLRDLLQRRGPDRGRSAGDDQRRAPLWR